MIALTYIDFIVAGVSLVIIAFIPLLISKLKQSWYLLTEYGVGITITSDDWSVEYLYRWLEAKELLRDAKHVGVKLKYKSSDEDDDDECTDDTKVVCVPKLGVTYLIIKGIRVKLEKTQFITFYGSIMETIHLTASGVKRQFLEDIMEEARVMSETRPAQKVVIYKAIDGEWEQICSRDERQFQSVVLDKGISESLLDDLKDFGNSKQWYRDRGVPHRRGYLLYGPPGCGKTSLIRALASEMKYAVCILNLKIKKMSDDVLSELMNTIPDKSFVLLEDVDSVFTARNLVENNSENDNNDKSCESSEPPTKVTFSGLLNATDGIASAEGRILFMTTNYIDKLDSALIRPGRVDRRQLIDYPTIEQAMKLLKLFYPEVNDAQMEDFGKKFELVDRKLSVAEIQGHFLLYKNDVKSAIQCLFNENGTVLKL